MTERPKPPPLWLRAQIFLAKRCGRASYGSVYFLLRNRVAKLRSCKHELDAMEFVRCNTTIPVPKVFRVCPYDGERQHLVMEKLPGKPLGHVIKDWMPRQAETFARDLADCIRQLRQLKPPSSFSSPKLIGSTLGGKNIDDRLSCNPFGPFDSVTAFHTYLRYGRPLDHWGNKPAVVKVHERPEDYYAVKFTHADLVPRNILVDDDGHITGIVDWEYAGWYPEYWEYTKAFWCEMRPVYDYFYHAIENLPSDARYPDELACEQAIWMRMSPFAYCDPPWKPGDDDVKKTD